MLFEKITTHRMTLRKEKEKQLEYNLLTSLYSDLSMEMKKSGEDSLSDDAVIALLNRYKKNLDENLTVVTDEEKKAELQREMDCILSYLPQQLSTDELKDVIQKAMDSGANNIGAIMGHLKKEYNGRFNPKEASALAKELLG